MDIRELYQEVILDHSRRPRNRGECPGATAHAQAENPSCGDEIAVHVKFGADHKVEALTLTGQGCALSQASASLMTLKVRGLPVPEAAEAVRPYLQEQASDLSDFILGDYKKNNDRVDFFYRRAEDGNVYAYFTAASDRAEGDSYDYAAPGFYSSSDLDPSHKLSDTAVPS